MKKTFKNARIKVFNAWWWGYVVMTLLGLLLVTMIGRGMDLSSRYRFVLILSILEYIILRLYKHSLKNIRNDYNYFNELPCYLCNQMTILCIIASVTRSVPVMSYVVSIGTLGAILAFTMPDSYNRDQLVFSTQAYGFYGYHGLLIITCLSFYTLGLYHPEPKDCIWAAVGTFLLAVLAHFINAYLRKTGLNPRSNYVFTYDPDNAILKTFYKILPVKLFYMLPVLPIFSAISFVFFFILKLFR